MSRTEKILKYHTFYTLEHQGLLRSSNRAMSSSYQEEYLLVPILPVYENYLRVLLLTQDLIS